MIEFSTIYEIVSVNYVTMTISKPFILQRRTPGCSPYPPNLPLQPVQWLIQDFPEGAPTREEKVRVLTYYMDKFSLKTVKMKEFGLKGKFLQ